MTPAKAKVVRAWGVDSTLALGCPVMEGRTGTPVISRTRCAVSIFLPSSVKLIVHSHPDHQPLVLYYDISALRCAYATAIETSSAAKP
jgi:hypothetical protein